MATADEQARPGDAKRAAWWEEFQVRGPGGQASASAEQGAIDFAAIVSRFESPLLRYVTPLSPTVSDAEDIVQDAFLRLHRQVATRGQASITNLSSWLFRVAHNLARDAGRKASRRGRAQARLESEADPAAAYDQPDALGDLEREESARLAMDELRQLPDHQQEVLLLKITQNMTLRQIAEATGLTVGNVGYRINQGLLELSKRLKRAGVI